MKTKTFIAGLLIIFALSFNTGFVNGQDQPQGTFIEESGESQDSTRMTDVLDFGFEEEESSNTGLIVGIAAIILIGGAIILFVRKKKK